MFLNFRCAAFFSLIWVWICLAMLYPSRLMAQDEGEETDDAMFAALDINEDGLLSGKEVKTVEAYDTNGDGRVTQEEFDAGRNRERGVDPAVEDEQLFAERDISEDGFLSGKEKKGLEKYDADEDGEITKEEFLVGRAAERGAKPKVNSQAARQAAEGRFIELDVNEDGRLSGTEVTDVLRSYDANGDKRISKEEFIAAVMNSQNGPPASGASALAPILTALKTMDPKPLLAKCREDLQSQVDEPVLRFLLELLQSEHGDVKPAADQDIEFKDVESEGITYKVAEAAVECEEGTIDCSVTTLEGEIVGFNVQSEAAQRFNETLYKALIGDQKFALKFAEYYAPQCEEFVKLIHAGKDEEAFARFHFQVQKKLGFESAQGFFANVRKTYGKIKSLELEGLRVEFDLNGEANEFIIQLSLSTDKGQNMAEVSMQFDGLKGHIVSVAEEKSQPSDDDDVPPPPKACDD